MRRRRWCEAGGRRVLSVACPATGDPPLQRIHPGGQAEVRRAKARSRGRLQQRERGVQKIAAGVVEHGLVLFACGGQHQRSGRALRRDRSGGERVDDLLACRMAFRVLLAALVALVRSGGDAAGEQPGISLDGHAARVTVVHARHTHASGKQTRRPFQEHQPDRRIHQLQRTVRACGEVGGAMGIAATDRARFAVGIERGAKGGLAERGAMAHEGWPGLRPVQVGDRLARQSEREVKGAQPGAGASEQGLEAGPVNAVLETDELHARAVEVAMGHGDRFGAAG